MLTFGSLFAGIGGIDLGLERAGMECRWQVERDEFCQRVLAKHWPGVPRYGDVHDCGSHNLEAVDLICGGFPCQPVSVAGRRQAQADDRWLWPEFFRIVRELGPRFVLVENVPGLLSTNRGSAFGEVLGDLASGGYDCAWDSVPAAAVGAPHLRHRVFLVAVAAGVRRRWRADDERLEAPGRDGLAAGSSVVGDTLGGGRAGDDGRGSGPQPAGRREAVADAIGSGSQGTEPELGREAGERAQPSDRSGQGAMADADERGQRPEQRDVPGQSQPDAPGRRSALADADSPRQPQRQGPVEAQRGRAGHSGQDLPDAAGPRLEGPESTWLARGRGEGLPSQRLAEWWAVEPNVGRVAYGVPSRVDRLRALGNAVVPQVAEWVGRRILEAA